MLMRYLGLGVGHVHSSLRAKPYLVKTNEVHDPFEGAEEFDDIESNEVGPTEEQSDSDEESVDAEDEEDGENEGEDYLHVDDEPSARL